MKPGPRASSLLLGAIAACSTQGPPTGGAVSSTSTSTAAASAAAHDPSGAAPRASSAAPGALPTPDRLFVGSTSEHACFVSTDRALYCWGRNDAGQLGRQ